MVPGTEQEQSQAHGSDAQGGETGTLVSGFLRPYTAELPDSDGLGGGTGSHEVYEYQDSKLREQHGIVPLWLWVVVLSLLVWGLYYLAAYWISPSPTIF